ncbi:MAG: TPM domain-containing protein [Pseudomonadota bacterium]
MTWRVVGLTLWLMLAGLIPAWAASVPLPALEARVMDQTGTLSAAVRGQLEQRLAELEQRKGSQIAVLLLPTTGDEAIEQFSIRLAEAWKLGRKEVDDGAILLVAIQDRTLRIEVGYGLEGAIPDAVAKRIIEEVIVPRFQAGDVEGGVVAGVDRLIGLVDGEALPEPAANLKGTDFDSVFPMVMVFMFVIGGVLRSLFGRLPGALIAGGAAFVGAWMIVGAWMMAAFIGLVVFIFTLGAGLGGGSGGSGGSGRSGGGGGWSSGGGGFSGGGGGFGGGGASGRW